MKYPAIFISFCLMIFLFSGCFSSPERETSSINSQETVSSKEEIEQQESKLPFEETIASITPNLQSKVSEQHTIYPDTVGWLIVPDTVIDTVIVQSNDPTNEYYLNHDLDGNPDKNGVYSVHTGCVVRDKSRNEISRNITLFAHNMDEDPDGRMFAQLKKFKDPDYARANPYLYFSTSKEDMVWEVFAVYDTTVDLHYIAPDNDQVGEREWEAILDIAQKSSLYSYGISVDKSDKILTLSTCSYDIPGVGVLPISENNNYRFVVMARLVSPSEPIKETAKITINENFLLPDSTVPPHNYLYFEGKEFELQKWQITHPNIVPIDSSNLEQIGTIQRSGIKEKEPRQDWDASFLLEGSEIYKDSAYPHTLVVSLDGTLYPYVYEDDTPFDETEWLSLYGANGVLIETVKFDEEKMGNIVDMIGGAYLPTVENISLSPEKPVVSIEQKTPSVTFRFSYYLGTPESIGKEVMITEQWDGYYYKDAEFFDDLLELFE